MRHNALSIRFIHQLVMYQWPTAPADGAVLGYGSRLEQIYANIFPGNW
jgi:hypothetical protein